MNVTILLSLIVAFAIVCGLTNAVPKIMARQTARSKR